jgi:hypothetical protein
VVDVRTGHRQEIGTIHERFGGVDTPSAIAGMFTSLGVLVFLSSLLAAWLGDLAYQVNLLDPDGVLQEFEVVAFVVLLVVVFIAFFVGGWAAGRMARIDGGITAVASAMWMLLVIVIFAAVGAFIGSEFNAFGQAGLPDWVSQLDAEDITIGAGLATIGTILIMFVASWMGGRAGETYRRDADRIAVRTTNDSVATPIT